MRDAIRVVNVGAGSNLSSKEHVLNARDVDDEVTIVARNGVELRDVGNGCVITSQQYGISVKNSVGVRTRLHARKNITVGTLGDYTQITSDEGEIKALEHSGDHITVEAKGAVRLKAVGMNAKITSQDKVSIRNIGIKARISAQSDACSSSPSSAKLGMFRVSVKSQIVKIPKAYKCSLTQEIMKEPVIFTIDNETYEKEAITEWIKKHRTSPSTGQAMRSKQTIEQVLKSNRALAEAIEEFQAEHPEFFTKQQLTP